MPSFLVIIQMHLFRSSDITPALMIAKGFMSYIHPYKQKKNPSFFYINRFVRRSDKPKKIYHTFVIDF